MNKGAEMKAKDDVKHSNLPTINRAFCVYHTKDTNIDIYIYEEY